MSIRYYLLLLAGCITTIVFVGSFFLDNVLFERNLHKVRNEADTFFTSLYEEKAAVRGEYLTSLLAKNLARLNVDLDIIARFPPLSDRFVSGEEGTWSHAADLLRQDDRIGFLQNMQGDGSLLSLIIPEKGRFYTAQTEPIEEGLAWVYLEQAPAYEKPFLGIAVPLKTSEIDTQDDAALNEILPVVYMLYDPNRLSRLSFLDRQKEEETLPEDPIESGEAEPDILRLIRYLRRAKALLADPSFIIPPGKTVSFPFAAPEETKASFEQKLSDRFLETIGYAGELFVIKQAAILKESGFFSQDAMPDLMTFSGGPGTTMQAVFLSPVLGFQKPIFPAKTFFYAHLPPDGGTGPSSGACVIKSSEGNRAFLGNTVRLVSGSPSEPKESFLTLGFDLRPVLESMIAGSGHRGVIIGNEGILVNLAPEGAGTIPDSVLAPLLQENRRGATGSFSLAGVQYRYFRFRPDPALDLDFFVFQTEEKEFGFLTLFQEKVTAIVKQNSQEKKILEAFAVILLWILLLNVSKKITNPILSLSQALRRVKDGDWEQIRIPKTGFSRNNELTQLFDAFSDMVEGMKEKEKIAGILNKVVSQEIAKEILRGDVKLGGEERIVSVLFADIRGFTRQTRDKPPHEVIEFLNTCMTKLSDVVEEHKGVIDKYLGDGLMALYGAPIIDEEGPLHAIESGLAMLNAIERWNVERTGQGLEPILIGIGIHIGPVFAGNMGALNRLNYTVIGSSVNLASRLCAAAGPQELLISQETYDRSCVQKAVVVEDKGWMMFKGFDEKQRVYRVTGLLASDKSDGKLC